MSEKISERILKSEIAKPEAKRDGLARRLGRRIPVSSGYGEGGLTFSTCWSRDGEEASVISLIGDTGPINSPVEGETPVSEINQREEKWLSQQSGFGWVDGDQTGESAKAGGVGQRLDARQ